MVDYKGILCEGRPFHDAKQKSSTTKYAQQKQNYHPYRRTFQPKTMDAIYEEIQYSKKSRQMNYKERMERNMQKSSYLMKDLFRQLSEYWQDFGFLSKSSSDSFAKALLPTIRVYHHHTIEQIDEDEDKT